MQVWRMRADGSEQTQITFDEERNSWFPHISPNVKQVVLLCYRRGVLKLSEHLPHKQVELRLMNADGTGIRTLHTLFGGQGTINVNSWSPDGKAFAFVEYRIRGIDGPA
jgi:Tol biopolymer transport system component